MTALQIEFNKLRETQRANEMNENIRSREASASEVTARANQLKAALEAEKAPYQIQQLLSEVARNKAQSEQLIAGIDKIKAEIDNINADTRLTQSQRQQLVEKNIDGAINLVHRLTGITPIGDAEDTLIGWISSIFGGVGKALGGKLIS